MANRKMSELAAILANALADGDLIPIVDVSAGETKVLTKAQLATLFDAAGAAAAAQAASQPLDSDLTAIAALSTTSFGRSLLGLADAAAARAALGAETSGAAAAAQAASQPLDSDLTAISALTTTSYGRSLLTLASVSALATSLAADSAFSSRYAPRFVVPAPTGNAVTDDANVQATLALAEAARGIMEFQACATGVFYNLTTTVNAINCDIDSASSAEVHSSASPAFRIGSTSAYATLRTYKIPAAKPSTDNTGVGVQITAASGCYIDLGYLGNFADCLVLKGENAKGVAYNTIRIGQIYYYTRGIVLTRATSGWSNQNTFIGGKVGCTRGGNAVSGVRAIQMGELTDLTGPPDSNLFLGTALEGDQPEYHLECVGNYNRFVGCRWETTVAGTARINWANVSDNSVGARYNVIEGGFSFYGYTETRGAAAFWNKLVNDTSGITTLDGDAITTTRLFAKKPSDQSVTSSTVLVNDADLKVALKDGSTYTFKAVLWVDATEAGDLSLAFTVPSGATLRWGQTALLSNATGGAFGSLNAQSVASGNLSSGGAGAGIVAKCVVEGIVTVSSTAGNLQLQFAQGVSNGTATKLLTNSYLEAIKVA